MASPLPSHNHFDTTHTPFRNDGRDKRPEPTAGQQPYPESDFAYSQAPDFQDFVGPRGQKYDDNARELSPGGDRSYPPASPRPRNFDRAASIEDETAEPRWRGESNSRWRRGSSAGYRGDRYGPRGYDQDWPRYRDEDEGPYDRQYRYAYDDRYDSPYGSRYDDGYRDRSNGRRSSYDDYGRAADYQNSRGDHGRSGQRRQSALVEKILRYPTESTRVGGKDVFGAEDQHALAATLAGAGGGALLGHELTDGVFGPIGGAIAGGILAKFAERKYYDKKAKDAAAERDNILYYERRRRSQSARGAVYDDYADDQASRFGRYDDSLSPSPYGRRRTDSVQDNWR